MFSCWLLKDVLTFDLVSFAEVDLAFAVSGVRTCRNKHPTWNSTVQPLPLTSDHSVVNTES